MAPPELATRTFFEATFTTRSSPTYSSSYTTSAPSGDQSVVSDRCVVGPEADDGRAGVRGERGLRHDAHERRVRRCPRLHDDEPAPGGLRRHGRAGQGDAPGLPAPGAYVNGLVGPVPEPAA